MVALTGRVPSGVLNLSLGVTDQQLNLDRQGSLVVVQQGSPAAHVTRQHKRYAASSATATAVAPVQAVPTTAAAWVLFNPVDNDKILVIESVACWSVSGTLGLGMSLLVGNALGLQTTAPTNAASAILASLSGQVYDSAAIFGTGHTITGGTPAWMVVASRDQVAAISVGSGLVTTDGFRGTREVSPGREFAMTVLAPTGTTALFGMAVEWYERAR